MSLLSIRNFTSFVLWHLLNQTTHCIDFAPVATNAADSDPRACFDRLSLCDTAQVFLQRGLHTDTLVAQEGNKHWS